MKRTAMLGLIVVVLLAIAIPAGAKKPVDDNGVPFGNGFPSGGHFNLNIIAKKNNNDNGNFTCPGPKYDPCNPSQQIYGNVIFIPRIQGTDPITILMESGKKGPKGAGEIEVLQVTDWCSESFPDDGGPGKGDSAILRLPANDKGYAVYARITGKPGEDGEPNATISPGLVYVKDEAGRDLILLGLVDRQGVSTFTSDANTIYRTTIEAPSSGKGGKGVQKASNMTALFEWTGEVCYVQEDSNLYCENEFGEFICSLLDLCCVDSDLDGVYELCDLLTDVGVIDPCDPGNIICPLVDSNDNPYLPVTAECRSYENEWIFNIADFVGYLWDIDSSGAYVIQVRFYPL